ncbi:MAG: SDR family NAD(P)-dependent oxidoreductase [Burkholderiales bacterium]|nr:SDR family NAD(P)-dependent oxidoreductase [Burkholderiales bacterium]
MNKFKDKVVVVTGAGSGMGRSYAMEFARCGAHLALMDYDATGLAQTVELVKAATNAEVLQAVFSVADRAAMFAFADSVMQRFGTVDVVINNAGVAGAGLPGWDTSIESYERVMGINFYGVLYGTKAFLPELMRKNSGHIVNVSSIFGLVGAPSHTDYSASKFAVRGFSEALMTELCQTNVGVHLVHPGGIATNIATNTQEGADFSKFNERYLTTSPDDIARVVRQALENGVVKVVYGNNSYKTWLGSNFVPLKWLNRIVWSDVKKTLNLEPYKRAGIR